MIQIKPFSAFDFSCPKCHSSIDKVETLFFQGMHVLAECTCKHCHFEFRHTLPIGHDLLFPIQLARQGNESYFPQRAREWLALPLIGSLDRRTQRGFQIRKKVNRQVAEVIVVNCLDSCFGHVFTKVWNCYTLIENRPDLGVIAIIPERCTWLLPNEVAEVWAVSIELKDCAQTVGGLDEFVKNQLGRFKKVSLSHAYTHLDHIKYLDMEKILKIPRFDLTRFYSDEPQFTFVLREDRFWTDSYLMNLLFKAAIKLKIKHLSYPLLWRQRHLVNRTAKRILKSLPNARLASVGLGKSGMLFKRIADHRAAEISPETETRWNTLYAKSHVVIGIHGSHMLIPTALAAGFLTILPRQKIEHIVEDSVLPYSNRLLQFMGRFLDEFSSPGLVARHAVSMVKDFEYVNRNLQQELE